MIIRPEKNHMETINDTWMNIHVTMGYMDEYLLYLKDKATSVLPSVQVCSMNAAKLATEEAE